MFKDIGKDKTLSKHTLQFSFNAPKEVHYTELKFNLFGQNTVQLAKDGEAFRNSLRNEYKPVIDSQLEYCDLYAELKVAMKSGKKLKYQ